MKTKVLQLISNLEVGGTENMLLLLDRNMNRKKFDVTVCTICSGGELEKDFRSMGIKLISLEIKNKLYLPFAVQKFSKLIRETNPDIVQSFLFPDNMIARLARRPKNTILINGKRDTDRYKSFGRIFIDTITAGLCDYIISNSESGVEEWLHRGLNKKKLIYIPNGKDFSYLRVKDSRNSVRKELGLTKKETAIGVVARLDVQKGHIYLLDAMKSVIKKYPNTKLFLVGDGPLREILHKKCKQLSIEKNIVFLRTRKDVPKLLKAFDIFVLPSLWEGMSGALMEAMAVGLPVIATAVDGNIELIRDGENGLLVPIKDSHAITNKIIELIENRRKTRKIAINAKKIIISYSVSKMINKYEEVFERVKVGEN